MAQTLETARRQEMAVLFEADFREFQWICTVSVFWNGARKNPEHRLIAISERGNHDHARRKRKGADRCGFNLTAPTRTIQAVNGVTPPAPFELDLLSLLRDIQNAGHRERCSLVNFTEAAESNFFANGLAEISSKPFASA